MELKLKGIRKSFSSLRGKHEALKGIDLEVRDEEFFVLLGPSGCGKSTLLNLIAGLDRPSSGEIWFGNELVAGDSRFQTPGERNVAMVFQNYALYPHMNVSDNIAFSLRMQKAPKREVIKAVNRAAATLKIEHLMKAKPRELSGGERQRVAIARALVRKPRLFLLDEPLSNLDAQLRSAMREELREIHRRLRITTVYVTHDQVEAMTMGERIAVFRQGRLEQLGTPEDLYRKPASSFVARFIGTPPMNLFKVDLSSRHGGEIILQAGKQEIRTADSILFPGPLKKGPLLAGVRPEHIRLEGKEGMIALQGKLRACEYLGREMLLHVDVEGQSFQVLTAYTSFKEGQAVGLFIDPRHLHCYPAEEDRPEASAV